MIVGDVFLHFLDCTGIIAVVLAESDFETTVFVGTLAPAIGVFFTLGLAARSFVVGSHFENQISMSKTASS